MLRKENYATDISRKNSSDKLEGHEPNINCIEGPTNRRPSMPLALIAAFRRTFFALVMRPRLPTKDEGANAAAPARQQIKNTARIDDQFCDQFWGKGKKK